MIKKKKHTADETSTSTPMARGAWQGLVKQDPGGGIQKRELEDEADLSGWNKVQRSSLVKKRKVDGLRSNVLVLACLMMLMLGMYPDCCWNAPDMFVKVKASLTACPNGNPPSGSLQCTYASGLYSDVIDLNDATDVVSNVETSLLSNYEHLFNPVEVNEVYTV